MAGSRDICFLRGCKAMDEMVLEIKETIEAWRARGHLLTLGEKRAWIKAFEPHRAPDGPILSLEAWEGVVLFQTFHPETRKLLRQSFVPNPHFSQPAIDAERRYGLSGIGRQYRMPEGLTPQELESYSSIVCHAVTHGEMSGEDALCRFQRVKAALSMLTPELQTLAFDEQNVYIFGDFFNGIASAFNVSDIQSYLVNITGHVTGNISGYGEMESRLALQGYDFSWVPSMKTLQEIDLQISEKLKRDKNCDTGAVRKSTSHKKNFTP